jgi:hypothetical protein
MFIKNVLKLQEKSFVFSAAGETIWVSIAQSTLERFQSMCNAQHVKVSTVLPAKGSILPQQKRSLAYLITSTQAMDMSLSATDHQEITMIGATIMDTEWEEVCAITHTITQTEDQETLGMVLVVIGDSMNTTDHMANKAIKYIQINNNNK